MDVPPVIEFEAWSDVAGLLRWYAAELDQSVDVLDGVHGQAVGVVQIYQKHALLFHGPHVLDYIERASIDEH